MMPWFDRFIALGIVAVWGFNFVVIKWGLAGVPPFLLGGLRFLAVSLIGMLIVPRPRLPAGWLALYGLAMGFGQFSCLFLAIKLGMPAGIASIVLQSQAFLTLIIAFLWLKESFSPLQVLGLVIGFAGLWCLAYATGSTTVSWLGFGLTLCAAASWAFSNVVIRAFIRRGHTPAMLGVVVWCSPFLVVPFGLFSWGLEREQIHLAALLQFKSLFAVGYLAVVASLFGYGQWARLLSRHPANIVAPYSLLVPLFGVLSAWVFLGERLSGWQWAGAGLLLGGLVVNVFGPGLLGRWSVYNGRRPRLQR
ncbi:EamA family transporter [Paludibacterium paludis]|nr:EamA family transporter [Paludibacterium paludis]